MVQGNKGILSRVKLLMRRVGRENIGKADHLIKHYKLISIIAEEAEASVPYTEFVIDGMAKPAEDVIMLLEDTERAIEIAAASTINQMIASNKMGWESLHPYYTREAIVCRNFPIIRKALDKYKSQLKTK